MITLFSNVPSDPPCAELSPESSAGLSSEPSSELPSAEESPASEFDGALLSAGVSLPHAASPNTIAEAIRIASNFLLFIMLSLLL